MVNWTVYDPSALGLEVASFNGREARVKCPYHDDHHPSASFNVRTGLFYCFVCSESRNATQLATDLGAEVVRTHKLSLRITSDEGDDHAWRHILRAPIANGNEYLRSRGIPDEAAKVFDIREITDGIAFPFYDFYRESITGVQIRRYHGRPRYFTFGKRPSYWPQDKTLEAIEFSSDRGRPIFLVEGIFGVLRAWMHGYAAFATMGASKSADAARMFASQNARVWFDDDDAGYVGAYKAVLISHLRIGAVIPGAEVDEADAEEWEWAANVETSQRPEDALKFIDDQDAFLSRISSIRRQIWNTSRGL